MAKSDTSDDSSELSWQSEAREYISEQVQISYKASLIGRYHQEHSQIRELYHDIILAYQTCDDALFIDLLETFNSQLRNHLLDEALNMYVYLKHYYADDKKRLDMIKRFNRTMQKSSRHAFDMIRRFTEAGENIPHNHEFLLELLEIGNRLEAQLAAEERHLYGLYQEPGAPLPA